MLRQKDDSASRHVRLSLTREARADEPGLAVFLESDTTDGGNYRPRNWKVGGEPR